MEQGIGRTTNKREGGDLMGFAKYQEDDFEIRIERLDAMERRINASKVQETVKSYSQTAGFNINTGK